MKRHVRIDAAILAVCVAFSAAMAQAAETATTVTTTETTTEEKQSLFAFKDRLNFGGGAGVGLWDDFDDETFAYRVHAWWEFIPWFAVEIEWLDMGQAEASPNKAKIDGFNLSGMPRVPFGDFAIFGKIGCYFWDGDQDADGGGDQDLSFGAGMTYKIPNLPIGVRAEWTRVYLKDRDVALPPGNTHIDEHIDAVTVGGYFHW
ncbi:MAG TPA: outer membrane beta-barrel protein [Candidatus Binatia bacterium]|nr:outer membrane beta-barrel protein [Candidatus Binatia bacterium]